jgi:hypothetical protein
MSLSVIEEKGAVASYWCGHCIIFFRRVGVDAKPDSNPEDHENKRDTIDDHGDCSIEVLKPPYGGKSLHGDDLWINASDCFARV